VRSRGLRVECQVSLPVCCGDITIDAGYRVDMLVENVIVIENKSTQAILPVHEAQLLTYLKLSGRKLGFLINWNVSLIKDGLRRLVNNL
jgi:GxxExxY protein